VTPYYIMPDIAVPERFLLNLGIITVAWTQTELVLDEIIRILWHRSVRHPRHKEMPRTSLSRKLEFATDYFRFNADLAPVKEEALALMPRMKFLGDERHWCVHGAVLDLHSGQGAYNFTRYSVAKNKQTEETKPVTADDLDNLSTHLIIFSEALAKFLVRLDDMIVRPYGA
jgi:hypothetical protein